MNINTKLKHTAISLVIALILAVSAAPVLPAYAAVGTSVNEEVVNQARSVASIIQTRIQLYWSDWVDKQIPYTQDPLANPAPTWATDAEIAGLVGGATPDGMTFTVEGMPVARDGSFYLVATVDSSMGGAAAASYVRNFLPMAIAASNSNVVKIPVLRPSFALGLSDLADNPNKVNRDGSTDDSLPTFTDNADITFGENGSITFDPATGGDINNVNDLDAKNITVSNTLTAGSGNVTGNMSVGGDLDVSGNITGNLTGDTTGTHTGAVIGSVTGNVTGNVTGSLTGNVTGNATTATGLQNALKISLGNKATGATPYFTGNEGTVTLDLESLNTTALTGRIENGRLDGTYDIGISGTAARANYASTSGLLKDTDGEAAGAFTIRPLSGGYIEFGGASAPAVVKFGATGTVRPTEYWFGALGDAKLKGIAESAVLAASATKLAAAKSIALGTAATGTATAFDGTGSITIPVTALNAGYLSAGTIPTARLSGTYAIGISGKAATAGAADTAASAATATSAASAGKLSASRDFNVTGAASGTATSFDGTGNVNIAVNSLDPTKLMAVDAAGLGIRYNAVSFNNNSSSLYGAIKIKIPGGLNIYTMMNIEIDVYEYNSASASKIIIGGYAYSAGGNWHNTSVSVSGSYSKGVRLANDGSGFCIILGNASTEWSYPKVNVAKVTAGYSNVSEVTNGIWTASLIASESGLINIVAPPVSGSTATKLAVARTIALGTGATGAATAFDGSADITIPVTALNAGYLSAGTIPTARLAGSYVIDISGTARYAQELSSPISSVAYATNSGTVGGIAADSFVRSDTADLVAGNHEFYSGSNVYYDAPIEIREVGLVCSGQSSDSYAPALSFHWGGRVATRILLAADGQLKIEANPIIHSGNIESYAAGNVTTPSGTYKHLGAWGVGRTAAGAILVNTAYTADVAGYATSSGYASSAGSATEIPVSISAPENGGAKMLIFPNSKLKIAYGSMSISRQSYAAHTFPVAFTHAVRAIHCNPSLLNATSIRSPRCSGDSDCTWSYMVMGY